MIKKVDNLNDATWTSQEQGWIMTGNNWLVIRKSAMDWISGFVSLLFRIFHQVQEILHLSAFICPFVQ